MIEKRMKSRLTETD